MLSKMVALKKILSKIKKTLFGISWPKDYVIALGVAFAYDSNDGKKINFHENFLS